MTNVYDSRYGRMAGGVVNTTIKSGTNQWHGDVFDYWRNSIFDANTLQNNAIGRGRGRHNQHQFGGVVGGRAHQNSQHWFNNNKACYSTRAPYTFYTNPDRFPNVRNPAEPQVNIAVEKAFPFGDRYKLTLRGEAFNLANTVIRPGPDTNFNDDNFGKLPLTQQNFPRLVQLAAKFYF